MHACVYVCAHVSVIVCTCMCKGMCKGLFMCARLFDRGFFAPSLDSRNAGS